MPRSPVLLLGLVVALVLPGCRTTVAPQVPPDVPPNAAILILADDEMPRVLYASAWGAFAEVGWDVIEHDSEAMRFVVRPEGMVSEAEVRIEAQAERTNARSGQIVVHVDPAQPDARNVMLGATQALATVPGRISFR